jgi:hypothetical protein
VASAHRRGKFAVENAALRRIDFHRAETPLVIGEVRRDGTFQRVSGIGHAVGEGHIDAAIDLGGGPSEINAELGTVNGDGNGDGDRFIEAVDENFMPVRAVWNLVDGLAHGVFGGGDNGLREVS